MYLLFKQEAFFKLFMSEFVMLTVLADALPAVRHRDANVGIFSAVCHQVVRLFVVTCSTCLFTCPCSTDEQGNSSKLAVISMTVVTVDFVFPISLLL